MTICRLFKQIILATLGCAIAIPSASSLAIENVCRDLVSTRPKTNVTTTSATSDLIAYITELKDIKILSKDDLELMLRQFSEGALVNPLLRRSDTNSLVHADNLEDALNAKNVDFILVTDWLKQSLGRRAEEEQNRNVVGNETRVVILPIKFNPIKAGSVLVTKFGRAGPNTNHRDITLTNDFEMMDSPVTQHQWAELMKTNPSHFSEGLEGRLVEIDGTKIQMQPNHPVENVTWLSAMEFANRLSLKHGLTPAYDLEGLEFEPGTSAERGTLSLKIHVHGHFIHQPFFKQRVKVNAVFNNIYNTDGYRLPTVAEHSFVRSSILSQYRHGNYYPGYDHRLTSETLSVDDAEKALFQDHPFFGLFKNVSEWAYDYTNGEIEGKDVVYRHAIGEPSARPLRAIMGGSWVEAPNRFRDPNSFPTWEPIMGPLYAMDNRSDVGFRLVRTLKKPSWLNNFRKLLEKGS